jgi:hypothetical protein
MIHRYPWDDSSSPIFLKTCKVWFTNRSIVTRTNNAHFSVAPRALSLKFTVFRLTFRETTASGQLRTHSRRGAALKHDFLLGQLEVDDLGRVPTARSKRTRPT